MKLKATNEQDKQTNKYHKHRQQQYDSHQRRGRGLVKGKGSQIYGDRRGFDFGWWALCHFINQCHSDKLN